MCGAALVTGLLGQQDMGARALPQPWLLCCKSHHHPSPKLVVPNSKRPNKPKTSHSTHLHAPSPLVREKQGRTRRAREALPSARLSPCLSPFLLTNTRLPVSALPPQTTAFLQPGWAGEIYGSQSEACPAGSSLRRSWNASRWGPPFLPYYPHPHPF